jgi:hypothetical protein
MKINQDNSYSLCIAELYKHNSINGALLALNRKYGFNLASGFWEDERCKDGWYEAVSEWEASRDD